MWIFSTERAIKELKERVDKLEHSARLLELEWSSTYDKFRSILARIAKRQSREAAPESETEAGFQEAEGIASPKTSASSLSARQREINERILMRRNRAPQEREQ